MDRKKAFLIVLILFLSSPFLIGGGLDMNDKDKKAKPPDSRLMLRNELSEKEAWIILDRGTEAPFSGKYWEHSEDGYYSCKYCNALLYRSQDKFHSDCGWPSFDDQLAGVVRRQADADGVRTEAVCANCDAHLGHVFRGEWLTPKNARYCINSIAMNFVPKDKVEKAIFAGGCFWGVEYWLDQMPGVLATTVGYTGGTTEHPNYQRVCDGKTGHTEAVEVLFDPEKTNFETLARRFFEIHDPTQLDRQGPDIGDQYRSAIFVTDAGQRSAAEELVRQLEDQGLEVQTRLVDADRFYQAEEYHQDYYRHKGQLPTCHVRVDRFGDSTGKTKPDLPEE
jgi:peptide methionine sulfoxide reductase msrA/msrB